MNYSDGEWRTFLIANDAQLPNGAIDLDMQQHACNNTTDCYYLAQEVWEENVHTLTYRVVATVLHVLVFLFGCFGNIVLIIVARRTKALQTPTYSYLVSLAYADLIVLVSAVPEAIMFHHIGIRWVLGQAGCSLMVFGNFLGINAGSLSILAFTVERYIAIVHPLLAQKVCTVKRANKVIVSVWIVTIIYCAPWLGLTEVRPDPEAPDMNICDFRLSKDQYILFFVTDLVLFYLVPLFCSGAMYTIIAVKLNRRKRFVGLEQESSSERLCLKETEIRSVSSYRASVFRASGTTREFSSYNSRKSFCTQKQSRPRPHIQALPMLMLVVILFAVCWLPFRGVLVYNSFAETPWLDLWFNLFAKTLIYINSAINPFLYNIMSRRFRDAVFRTLGLSKVEKVTIHLSSI